MFARTSMVDITLATLGLYIWYSKTQYMIKMLYVLSISILLSIAYDFIYVILMAQEYVGRNNIRLIYDSSRIGKYGYSQLYDFLLSDDMIKYI